MGADSGTSSDATPLIDSGAAGDSAGSTETSPGDSSSFDATLDGGHPNTCGLPYVGVLAFTENTVPTPTTFEAVGEFSAAPSTWPVACAGTVVGPCCYQDPSSAPSLISAGTITVANGMATLAELKPPNYSANSPADVQFTWAPGDTLSVTANGGTVDAFMGSVTAPALLKGISPSFSLGEVTISLKSDWVVSWSPVAAPSRKLACYCFNLKPRHTSTVLSQIQLEPSPWQSRS